MILSATSVVLIIVFIVIALAYFFVGNFMAKINSKDVVTQVERNVHEHGHDSHGHHVDKEVTAMVPGSFNKQEVVDQIQDVAFQFYIKATIFALAFSIVAWVVFYASFSAKYSLLWSILSLVFGFVSIAVTAFLVIVFSINTSVRFLNEAAITRGRAYAAGWLSGSSIAAGVFAINFTLYLIIYLIAKNYYIGSKSTEEDKQVGFYFSFMGYVWGILSGVFFYRNVGYEVGKGLASGSDLYGVSQRLEGFFDPVHHDHHGPSQIILQGKVVGNLLSKTLTNIIDFIGIISTLLVVYGLVVSTSSEIVAMENQASYYFPLFIFTAAIILQIILAFISLGAKGEDPHESGVTPATFTAKNNTLQVILTDVAIFLLLLFIPLYFFPSTEFTIGSEDYKPFYYEKISSYSIVWCVQTGLVTQILVIFVGELFTSNGFFITRRVALESMKSTSVGISTAFSSCSIAQAILLFIIGTSIMICYLFAGFLGIACGLIGIVSTPILLMTITIFGGAALEGSVLARIGGVEQQAADTIRSLTKGAQNYLVYLELVNSISVFYLDFIMLGLLCAYSKLDYIAIWDTYTIFGIFLGGTVVYYLRGSSSFIIQAIQTSIGKGEITQIGDSHFDGSHHHREAFFDYVNKFFMSPAVRTIINLVIVFFLVLILAFLFGSKTVIGFVIGVNLLGVHIILYSALLSNQARNASLLNQDAAQNNTPQSQHLVGLKGSLETETGITTSETLSLLPFILVITLFVMMGSKEFWGEWGVFAKVLDDNHGDIASKSVGIWDWAIFGTDENTD